MAASSASSPVSLVVVNSATGDWRLDIINPAATDETVTLSMPMHPDGDETGRTWSATTQMTTGLAASGIDEIDVSFTLAAHGKVTFSGRSTFADGAKRVSILYTSTMLAKTYLGYINFFFTDDRRPIANDVDLPKNFFDEHALTQTDLDGFFNGRWTMSEVISYLRSNQNSTAFNPDGLTIEVIGDQATVNMANAVIGALAENTPIAIDSFTVGLAVSLNDGSLHPVYLGDVYDTAADALALAGTKQAADATLTALAGLATQADTMIYFSGTDAAALISVSSWFRSIMASANAAALRSNLALVPGVNVVATSGTSSTSSGIVVVNGGATSVVPFKLKGVASQAANLFELTDDADVVKAFVSIAGGVGATGGIIAPYWVNATNTEAYIALTGGSVLIQNRNTVGNKPLIVQGMAGQTGDNIQVQTSTGTVIWAVTAAGAMELGHASDTTIARVSAGRVSVEGNPIVLEQQAINAQTETTYTLAASDCGKLVSLSNASAITLTLPQDSDATIPIGTYVDLYQLGAGQVTVAAGTGATLRVSGLTAKARAQYSRFAVQKVSANTWSLMGDLAAS